MSAMLLTLSLAVKAQNGPKTFTPAGALGFRSSFNLDDISMGAEGGITIPDYRSSLLLGFDGRLGSRRVVVPDEPGLYYILRERRYMLTLDFEQRFKVAELGSTVALEPYVRVGGGLTFGNYRAFGVFKPHSGLMFIPSGGFAFNIDETFVARIGYQYLNSHTASIEPHRIVIGGTFSF